ncbi:MAG: hypothetical protein ACJ72U_10560 [Nitrososphaeraceae archaeon]
MVNYCFALPYLPGGAELAKKFVQENGNTKEHDEFYRIAGISRETIWIQRSPPGSGSTPDLQVVSIETDDLATMLKEFATSTHPWAIKFREYAKKAYGIDFSGPTPPPLNENIADWKKQSI